MPLQNLTLCNFEFDFIKCKVRSVFLKLLYPIIIHGGHVGSSARRGEVAVPVASHRPAWAGGGGYLLRTSRRGQLLALPDPSRLPWPQATSAHHNFMYVR
jgi:hypothetical protein